MGQMSLLGGSVVLLLLINNIGATVIPLRELRLPAVRYAESYAARAAGEEYRLPLTVRPDVYRISLTPNYTDFATFTGEVEISVTALRAADTISLHYNNINITDRKVIDSEDNILTLDDDQYNQTTNIYTITLSGDQKLAIRRRYKIFISYTGYLLDDMSGFYRSSYTTADGEKRWLVTTQFEPTDARRAFPCFDEPGIKASFIISIRRPTHMRSISNTLLQGTIGPIEPFEEGGLAMDTFRPTPPMSTYLVAFIVSDFKFVTTEDDHHLYRIWARGDSVTQGVYGLSVTPGIIQFMEDFTNILFEFDKLDQAAIPDFSAGAMENWALVTYRERLMLFKDDTSTTSSKQNIATVIAHELGHQWFGDLVSPEWWDFLWLNEGFATYFEYFATHAVERNWRLDHQFIVDVHQYALGADASLTTHPITTTVYSPAEISSIFDSISYDKAGTIIRTAEHFLTREVFVNGLRKYLRNRAHNSANPNHLFAALKEAADEAKIFSDSDLDVILIMESWTLQSGYPLITANKTEDGSIHIKQERFLLSGQSETAPNTTWWVPITYTKESKIDFNTTAPKVWMKNVSEAHIAANLTNNEWFVLNIQETAFYRVLYDEQNYKLLTDYLHSENHNKIHPLNKAQILDDSLNLARAGVLEYKTALDLTKYLAHETDFIPWVSYFRGLSFLNSRLTGTEVYDKFKSYVLKLLDNMYNNVAFTALVNEEHSTKLIRSTILTYFCNFDSQNCLDSASEFFRQWKDNDNGVNTIPPDLRSVVYCSALSNGGKEEWNFLWDQYKKSTVATDQVLILAALGCTKDAELLNTYLQYSITPNSGIRTQDSQSVFSAVYSRAEGVDVAFTFLTENFGAIQEYYTSMNAVRNIISGIASRMTTTDQRDKLKTFIDGHKELGTGGVSALETVNANLEWFTKYGDTISEWLDDYNSAANYLRFNPIISIVILSGYLIAK